MNYTPVQVRFKKNLKRILKEKLITQTELSYKTGIGQNTLSRYMTNKIECPSMSACKRIARALEISVGELLKEEDENV